MRRAWKRVRYRLEWLGLKAATKFVPLLSRKACYRLALLFGSRSAVRYEDAGCLWLRTSLTPAVASLEKRIEKTCRLRARNAPAELSR
jgi:hypothetical protein